MHFNKILLVVFALFAFSIPSFATFTPNPGPSVSMAPDAVSGLSRVQGGSYNITDYKNLICLSTQGFWAGAVGHSTLRAPGASSGYTPSGSNKFFVLFASAGIADTQNVTMGVSNTDGGVGQAAATAGFLQSWAAYQIAGNTNPVFTPLFSVPNGQFLEVYLPGASPSTISVCGYEQP